MSYKFDKSDNSIVISGFEQGIADSPYKGIANMRNVNIKYADGVAYVNYKRLAATISGGTFAKPTFSCVGNTGIIYILDNTGQVWKQKSTTLNEFDLLPGNPALILSSPQANGNGIQFWNNYLFVFRGKGIDVCGDGSGDGGVTFNNWNGYKTYSLTGAVSSGATSATLSSSWSDGSGTYIIIFSDGEYRSVTLTNSSTAVSWTGGLTNNVTSTLAVNEPNLNNGSATGIYTWLPFANISGMSLSGSVSANATTATISSWTDANGISQSGAWLGATGTYQMIVTPNGGVSSQTTLPLTVNLVYNSTTISFTATPFAFGSTVNLLLLTGGSTAPIMTLVSRNDGNLYFCNGNAVGSLSVPINIKLVGQSFDKREPSTLQVNYGSAVANGNLGTAGNAIGLQYVDPQATVVWLEELSNNMLIASQYKIYTWNFSATTPGTPVPIVEKVSKMINILNNIYIFAGQKGNIYLYNGYSASPFKKIPDYIANGNYTGALNFGQPAIDPQWVWGGIMQHRQKLYFQALAINSQTSTNIMSGIFSLSINNPVMITGLETVGALTIEAQNSFGLNASTTLGNGILIDDLTQQQPYDNYYSAWSSGSSTGGIDYNSTTLWSSGEPWIETDLIPIGNFLNQKTTNGQMEFKFDQPMQSGDSISVYARQHLSDTYVLVGTTSTQVLSAPYPPNFEKSQWIQFAVSLTCNATSTSSSFDRFKELRLRI